MKASAERGNLANAALALEGDTILAHSLSLVASHRDATAHAELMLVREVCALKQCHFTPGLVMVTALEPCLMCLSACAQAGYREVRYIISAERFKDKINYVTDVVQLDKAEVARHFVEPLVFTHMKSLEEEFCVVFEQAMQGSIHRKSV